KEESMGELKNKRALVTGAAGGIGQSISELFMQLGAKVMLCDIREEEVAKVAASLDTPFVRCDVSVAADVEHSIKATVSAFGGIDVLVCNAGIEQIASLVEQTEADFDRIVAINLKSVFFGIKYGAPAIIHSGGGAIVNVASLAAQGGC